MFRRLKLLWAAFEYAEADYHQYKMYLAVASTGVEHSGDNDCPFCSLMEFHHTYRDEKQKAYYALRDQVS